MRWLAVLLVVVAACGNTARPEAPSATTSAAETSATSATTTTSTTAVAAAIMAEGCADVVAATVEPASDGTWRFSVTVSSADTGWDKYADAWEVRLPDGTVLGVRELAHPHVDEQPFTRSLSGVEIPPGTDEVVIAARDSVVGFCGEQFVLGLG